MPTVIAINNSADLLNVMRDRLIEQGFTVYLRHPSSSTYALLKELEKDLIILDLVGQDGHAQLLFERICLDRTLSRVPLIVMLAPWQKEEFSQRYQGGKIVTLVKPFTLPDLLAAIDAALPDQLVSRGEARPAG